MQQAKRSFLGLLISLFVHGLVVGILLWNWHKPSDSANNHTGELATTISMEMLQGMRIVEPTPEPELQKAEPELPKEEVVADPTKKPEPEKKKEPEKKIKEKIKPPKEKLKKEIKSVEKKQILPKDLPVGERNVNAASSANSKATTTGVVNSRSDMVGSGTNTNEIAAYKAALYREIERRKQYPTRAKMMRKQGVVHISFNVGNDGVLSGESVVKSSGDESLDNAALKAVQSAKSVGPKPTGFAGKMSVPIRFSLQ
ncbi:TonB family protein [Rodentibacter trehalosifermentans]|uniref:Protein TonB n=1 Tax=Rodentibacter trehalosifermentans TaxID=1908263 RepID=A0A1V3J5F3_9PAST|nr:energy transducer TonB [Rodentibacter trehalosifermentans]OOF46266.1 energy transducer TonB [Rodentibacter trehalosifermentans]OOF46980.1 energy transducer TonB [Rodentibacter trehalosifermentans]OOF50425.1 energy transducer TonB [Rodentibacter trehalosifermentans]